MDQSEFSTVLTEAQETCGKIIEVYEQSVEELAILQKGHDLDPDWVDDLIIGVVGLGKLTHVQAQIARIESLGPAQLSNLLVVLAAVNRDIRPKLAGLSPSAT